MGSSYSRRRSPSSTPALFLVLVSAGSLGFAFYAQYIQKLLPCLLCLYQRVPYYSVLGLALVSLLFLRQPGISRGLIYLCGLAFAIGAGIALYHVGVQELWWDGPEMCGGLQSGASNIADLKAQLLAQPIVRCDKIEWKLFGITMPTVNLFFSIAMAVFCFMAPSSRMMRTHH
ncbi:disulfide bond formation protein B [uncultured Thalassospira sp.]|jgi:disulfide bond formation protein DsbB|uniref:disulfide bond formation protein B n=1 Tax=uncultured Thalassospira sp. TaxID=404382 RepID=UPI0030DA5CEF|tara:strand:+ start:4970 stop:5488 length:519 start_codon:yes stop_codon:yes gene_type:complete